MVERLHLATGLGLVFYVFYHLWVLYAATGGREAYLMRLGGALPSMLRETLGPLLLALVFVHVGSAGLRVFQRRRIGENEDPAERGFRQMQILTGILVLGFVGVHVFLVGGPLPTADPLLGYETSKIELGRPVMSGIHALGISAVAIHVGQGLVTLASRAPFPSPVRVFLRGLFILLAFALWLLFFHVFSFFATGVGLLPGA